MKILHTISGFGKKSGGTSTSTYELLRALRDMKCNVELMTLDVKDPEDSMIGNKETWLKVIPNDSITPFAYSKKFKDALVNSDYDLYHINGLWMYPNHVTCLEARKKRKPYIITPHGMLYSDALKRSYWKKWLMLKLFFEKDIMRATCIHATCRQEMEHIRDFGYLGPIAIIPNPLDIPEYVESIYLSKKNRLETSQIKKFGFLGRLHPVKKIENLIYAMAALNNHSLCRLVIIGKGDISYENFLRSEVKRLGLKNVEFAGFVTGKEKYEMLADFAALFVPSDFENFGMIVPEALSVGTPVMASLGTPWEELNSHQCGWWTERTPNNIAYVMQKIIDMPIEEILHMGERGRNLVLEKYTAELVASKMQQLYLWLLNNNDKPNFMFFLNYAV